MCCVDVLVLIISSKFLLLLFGLSKILHSAIANSLTFENQVNFCSGKGLVLMHKVVYI